ncbi:MAG: type II secretion system F family protein [Acetatifactor sp.]
MASFGYVVMDGAGKESKGSIEADSIELARQELKKQGNTILDIKEQSILNKDINIKVGGWPKPRDLSVWCRQFVSMSKAGVTIIESLKMLAEQTENERLREASTKVRVSVEKGETLANSLAEHPKVFPSLLVNMVAAGEASGSLDVALDRMSTHFEKASKTKALVKKAMIYPVVVICVAIAVVIVMLTVVIPNYTKMFADLGTDLPAITKAVQKLSDFLIDRWMIIVPVLVIIVLCVKAFANTDQGRHFFHKLQITTPILKTLIIKQSAAGLSRTMSTLLAAGVPLVEAVEIVASTMDNVYYKEAMQNAKMEIMIGQPLSRPLEQCGLFPPMVYHMVRIGEETGNTEEMLSKLADYYDDEVEVAVQSFMAALEPLIIVVLAVIVLVLVGACMAPMLSMYQAMESL